ncbi:MAG: hypothetical protein M1835_001032 [Candelina submexicana]|nr:MAG: hypothetical protein M1835_001032 [Candelina submexicana]
MFQSISLLLPLLPLVLSAPTPANIPSTSDLKPWEVSDFNFKQSSVDFTFKDPNTKVQTTCSASSSIPTTYTACKDSNVEFKFATGDKVSDFHIDLKETYTFEDSYIVGTGSKEVTNNPRNDKSPKRFDVPIQNVYPFQPFQLPAVDTFSPSGRPGSSPYSNLNFTFTDVNGNGKATTQCFTQWLASGQPDKNDIHCADSNFVFRFTQYSGIGQFTLALSHTYFLQPS